MWDGLLTRLAGSLVTLEPLARRHEQALFDASRDPRVWTWLPVAANRGGPSAAAPSRAGFDAWFASALDAAAAGREAPLATVHRESGRAIGSTRFMSLRPEHRGLEIGWTWLRPEAWSTGANIEAKLLMLSHAFSTLGCLRVEFKTDARNERSRAALAALPAHFEGVFRRHMVVADGVRDSAYYSVVDEEWPLVRDHLAARLRRRGDGGAQSTSASSRE